MLFALFALPLLFAVGYSQSQPVCEGNVFKTLGSLEDFSLLKAAIEYAGLDSYLKKPAAEFTILAPTNAAFGQLLGTYKANGLAFVDVGFL